MSVDVLKRRAAEAAVNALDISSIQVLGIGSGTTMIPFVSLLKERLHREKYNHIICVPSSFQARQLIFEHGLTLGHLEKHPHIDVTIDGADEVDDQRNLIKGGGGCHLQEKLLAFYSHHLFIIVDEHKRATYLGDRWKRGIPVEVLPMAYAAVQSYLKYELNFIDAPLRMAVMKAGPIITDQGNFIIDAQPHWPDWRSTLALKTLEQRLKTSPGVLETGLFIDMAERVYVAKTDGSIETMVKQ
jgi:ribose 5-phosphate isomerase A